MELRKDWLVCLSFADEDGNLLYQMDSCFIPNIGEAVYFSSAKTRYIIENRVVEINNQMMYVTLFLSRLTQRAADVGPQREADNAGS